MAREDWKIGGCVMEGGVTAGLRNCTYDRLRNNWKVTAGVIFADAAEALDLLSRCPHVEDVEWLAARGALLARLRLNPWIDRK